MKEKQKHIAAYDFYRDHNNRSYQAVAKAFNVSVTSVKKWAKEFNWQRRIAAWDMAIREGLEEAALSSVVDTRIKALEQTDEILRELTAVKPALMAAIQSCTYVDEETGKRVLKNKVRPGNTNDMVGVCNSLAKLNASITKIIELNRKIMGESDNINNKIIIEVQYEDDEQEQN